MFAFALWDEDDADAVLRPRPLRDQAVLLHRQVGDVLYFASEAKALLPFLPAIETDLDGLKDYLTFQFCLAGKTLFKGVRELLPGHFLRVAQRAASRRERYWEVYYELDFDHTATYFEERIEALLRGVGRSCTCAATCRSARTSAAASTRASSRRSPRPRTARRMKAFTGRFPEDARLRRERATPAALADAARLRPARGRHRRRRLRRARSSDVIYHLDYPVAGPGSFPQYMVSEAAGARSARSILGGQGGDEIFGGYTRYLIAYFEQCIKARDRRHDAHRQLRRHLRVDHPEPRRAARTTSRCCKEFWRDGLFEDLDARYFRLINRAPDLGDEVDLDALGDYSPFETFQRDLQRRATCGKESYFDKMTHFDFKTLLPALLQVEDRVSMAHGLESRVPLLDHPLVELAATIPADVKFKDGHHEARASRRRSRPLLPDAIARRARTRWASRCRCTSGSRGARRATSSPTRFVDDAAREPRARSTTARCSPGSSSENRVRPQDLGPALPRALAAAFHDREPRRSSDC